jgi:hypothetical protein
MTRQLAASAVLGSGAPNAGSCSCPAHRQASPSGAVSRVACLASLGNGSPVTFHLVLGVLSSQVAFAAWRDIDLTHCSDRSISSSQTVISRTRTAVCSPVEIGYTPWGGRPGPPTGDAAACSSIGPLRDVTHRMQHGLCQDVRLWRETRTTNVATSRWDAAVAERTCGWDGCDRPAEVEVLRGDVGHSRERHGQYCVSHSVITSRRLREEQGLDVWFAAIRPDRNAGA